MCATPILLGRAPAGLPPVEAGTAIEGLSGGGRRATETLVVATVALLLGTPSKLPMLLAPLAVIGLARMATDGAAISLFVGIPHLPTRDRDGAVVNHMTGGCRASSALMQTAPRLLGVVPCCLPFVIVHVAVIRVASTTCVAAAPPLLVLRPAFFPITVSRLAVVRLFEGCGLATFLLVRATPFHLRLRPCQLPNCILDAAIKRIASPSSGVTTPSLLVIGPTSLPIVETLVAIERHRRRLNQATDPSCFATMLLLVNAPACSPIVHTLLAIERPAGLACGLATKLFLVIAPILLPFVNAKIAIVEHSWRGALASSPKVFATIVTLFVIPLCAPGGKTNVAVKFIAALARLDATPCLLAIGPEILPI